MHTCLVLAFLLPTWPLIEGVPSSCYTDSSPTFLALIIVYILWTHRINPGSVPFSIGTKGLECSPSTPTMNSYFYKFMINLLKRFSSERKLLEVRGGFIIRLASAYLLCSHSLGFSFSYHARGQGNHFLFHSSLLLSLTFELLKETKKVPPSHQVAGATDMG